jgi:hypothetical protein
VTVLLEGCYGTFPDAHIAFGSGEASESAQQPVSTPRQDEALINQASGRALRAFKRSVGEDRSFVDNLLRCGLPLDDFDRTAFLAIEPRKNGAVVVRLDPLGTAARAGVRVGDVVTTLGEVPVTAANISALVAAADESGRWVIQGTRDATFDTQNAAWYRAHPISQAWPGC